MNAHRETPTKVLTDIDDQPENPALLQFVGNLYTFKSARYL